MNYYPYYNMSPYMFASRPASTGLFSRLFGGIKWSSLFNGTQKTLSFVNQAIPLVKQTSPLIKNAKTMFKVMSEFKKFDTPTNQTKTKSSNLTNNETTEIKNTASVTNDNNPVFFI